MATLCCGAEHATNFCPTCGKPLTKAAPLASLLTHLRTRMEGAQRHLAQSAEFYARNECNPAACERKLKYKQTVCDKWKMWHDALAELIEG